MQHTSWKEWFPGLDNGHLTLKQVRDTLPANQPEDIHWLVRLFENPASKISFRGAVSLRRHDFIHILLGRGLLSEDEAFVIGYTMGTVPGVTNLERILYKWVARYIYPKPYKMSKDDLVAYDLGFTEGKASPVKAIYKVHFAPLEPLTLAQVRQQLGIDTNRLRQAFAKEKIALPNTKASGRLPAQFHIPPT
ncbi:MAG: hypothetical protein IPP74_08955 [Alphaproteobacteria bacterium]|nr:hypothetical protein [Alphaproteobacteria bacterium]